jgi:hypothetical protein
MNIAIARTLSDAELVAELKRLAGCEREATVRLIIHLAELDMRRLYLGAGFSSLFEYCTEVLRLSEHETYNRIEAARALRRYPAILDLLVEGSLTLTTVRLLAPHLTAQNEAQLLAAARGKSKRQVEEVLAGFFPRPELPALVRKLPQPRVAGTDPVTVGTVCHGKAERGSSVPDAAVGSPPANAGPASPRVMAPASRPTVTPVAAERYQIRFTAGAETYEKLRLVQDLLRHAVPDGDPSQIMDRALNVLLHELARGKFAATERPRRGKGPAAGSRHIPAAVKRVVWVRDLARCAFIAADGRRCSARAFLEFHHTDPHGVGGKATVEKIQLRCKAHNNYEAQLYYGPMRERLGTGAVKERNARYEPAVNVGTRSGTTCGAGLSSQFSGMSPPST